MSEPLAYAGFWRRTAAALIDTLLLLIIIAPSLYWLYGADYFLWLKENDGLFDYYGTGDLLLTQGLPLVLALFFWRRDGATPGKRLLGCRIVDAETGGLPGVGQSVGRYFAYLLSMLPLNLGFLWVAWDKRKQGFHDKLTGTLVIYAPEDESQKSLDRLQEELR